MNLLATLLAQSAPPAGSSGSGAGSGNPLGGTLTGPGAFQVGAGRGVAAGGRPLEVFISTIIGFLTVIGGLMFLIYVLLGALNWITSGGDKGKVEAARSQITSAIVGLIIVLLSQAFVGIASGVLGLDILNPAATLGRIWGN